MTYSHTIFFPGDGKLPPPRVGSRMALPMAKACGVSLMEDFNVPATGRFSRMSASAGVRMSHAADLGG